MNRKILYLNLSLIALIFMVACNKQIENVQLLGGTDPKLQAGTPISTATFTKTNESFVWNTLSWTNPNYQLNTGTNSINVVYTLQIDSVGKNFKTALMQEISVSSALSMDVTVKQLNTALAKLGFAEDKTQSFETRLKSTLTNNAVPLYSNVLTFQVVPYLDVAVPLPFTLTNGQSSDLFLVGNATPGGWDNPVPVPSQKFSKTSSTTYEITIPLTGGKEYLFLPKNGDWGKKYAVANKNLAGLNTGGDFGVNLSDNLPGPAVSGTYKIIVDFKTGRFTVTKL